MASPHELAAMRLAIALSAFGLGTTSPNPPVGCVILDADGQVVGQGYHRRKGEPHAEANALTDAGNRAHGGTAVVTLEPCNHYGRTPPCHQALIDAGIRRVVVALLDPTSRGEGGVVRLRQAGIEVETNVLNDEAQLVLGPWLRAFETKRPWVRWVTVLGSPGDVDVLGIVPDANALKASHDVGLYANGRVVEAVPGAHGDNLILPTRVDLVGPMTAFERLYRGGVRRVLMVGHEEQVQRLLNGGMIDQMSLYLRDGESPNEVLMGRELAVIGGEGRLFDVATFAGWARLDYRRPFAC